MSYHCHATSIEGFIQQLACNYLPHGYWFYVTGQIPDGKDPCHIDAKLIERYGISLSRSARARRKQAGQANLHYLRFENFFVLLATHGQHSFFENEAASIRDVRRVPIRCHGYSISVKQGGYLRRVTPSEPLVPDSRYRVRVRISRERFTELKAYLTERATHDVTERLAAEFYRLPFEPYAPVRQQLGKLLSLVNKERKEARMPEVPLSSLRMRRRIVKPFTQIVDNPANDREDERKAS